jgi:hypothetical protein
VSGPSHLAILAAANSHWRRGDAPGNASVSAYPGATSLLTGGPPPACDGGAVPLGADPRPGQRHHDAADLGRGDPEGGTA